MTERLFTPPSRCHLIWQPGDRRVMCGPKTNDVPHVWVRYIEMHHPHALPCEACETVYNAGAWL